MVRRVTEDDIGIRVLREAPVDTPATNIIDIVAIHGIGAHPDDSWCKNVGTTEDPRWVNWLDNEAMLPAVATQARILRYGYESQWFGLEAMRQNVTTVANRFLIALQRKREDSLYRPIIFIAHCFGGLVVLKALLEAQHDNDLRGIFASTTGLVFFGTPFRGAEGMSQMEMLEAARREYQEDEIHPDVLNVLEPGNEFLQELVDRFGKTRRLENKAQIACFYELKPSNVGKIVGGLDRRRFVVSESSGSLDVADGTSKFSLSRTHFNMNKFGKATEEDFETVIYVIKKMIEASHGLTLARSSSSSPLVTRPLKPVPQSDSLFPTKNYRNFRLRGIPVECQSRADVRELVKRILSINFGTSFVVHSLASNPLEIYSKVATLSFQTIPDSLSSAHTNEWAFSLPPDLNSDNDRLSQKRSLVFDTHFSGFTPLQHMEDEGCKIDIVALSGPGGHAFGSFQEKEGSFMWLRDALPLDIPSARILIYGYDTDLAEVSSFQNFSDLAKTFEIDVESIRQINPKRPIVFFGHSLGGLVIKEALVNNKASTEETSASILNFTAALFYFGVPHLGMSVEALIPLMNNVPNSSIFEHLKKDSFPLQQLERDFKAAVGARSPQIYSFFELEKSLTAIKGNNGTWKLSGPSEILVEPSSATCGSKNQHPTNNRNHAELVKYGNQYEPIYNCIRVSLLSIVVKESRKIDGNREAGENLLLPLSDANLDCLKSLGFRDQENRFNGIHSAKNTCEWLLEDPQYRLWMNEPRGLFWIKGNPGAGKSVLMKFAVMRMNHENPGAIVLSFFLHGRGKILQKTPLGLFRALLNSMLKYFPQYLSDLTKLFEDREKRFGSFLENRWDWAEKELQEFMLKVLTHGTRNRPVIMFVDALDECGKDVAKGLLTYFKDIMEEIESNGAQVKICFSSRHYPILGHGTMPGISVEERNDKDIRSVIQRKFKEIEPEARRRQLEKDILLKAQGGFQWAVLVADMIADENATGTKAEKLIEKLASTPEDLEELYTEILSNATDAEKEQMVKLAQWILFSERPLSVQELRDALATDKEMTYTTVSELRSDEVWIQPSARFERYVTHISRGLVEFQTREVWEQYEPGEEEPDREAQFIHQSVADHMLNKFLSHSDCVRGSLSQIGAGHFQISRSCFKYLALKEVLEGDSLSRGKFSVQFPLAPYAVRFLFDHIKQVEQARVSQIDLLSLIPWELDLVSMKKFASIWRKLDPDTSHAPIGWPFAEATVLHILVALGSKTAFEASIEHYDGDMNGRDSGGYTPLLLAIRERHYDLALSLLDWSMNGKEHHRKSPPQDILMNDDDIPISRFVDVNTKNDEGETPLTVALTESAGDVIFKLIESGAELEYFGAKSALLHYTICQRDEKLLKKLIEKRFSLDGGVYFAVKELSKGEDKVLESFISRLLEAGADTTKLPDFNKSVEQGVRDEPDDELDDELDDESEDAADNQALILASGQGQTKIVNLLLSYGASPIYQNEHGDFPLMEATLIRHEKLIETLLQADPSAATMQDDAGDTSLHIAVKHGHKNIVEMLIQKVPSATNIANNRDETPLHSAVRSKNIEIILMLLYGDVSALDMMNSRRQTPLELAVIGGNRAIVKLLLMHVVDVDSKTLNKSPWLIQAAIEGNHHMIELLQNRGLVSTEFEHMYRPLLQLKTGNIVHFEVIKRLVINNWTMDYIDNTHHDFVQVQLFEAAKLGHELIIRVIIYISCIDFALPLKDKNGQTLLSLAAENGHEAIVKLLLGIGKADPDSRDSDGNTPLSRAASNGHLAIVKLLLDTGKIDVDTKDPDGWTPIMWALSVENMDLATILQSYSRERTYHALPRPT